MTTRSQVSVLQATRSASAQTLSAPVVRTRRAAAQPVDAFIPAGSTSSALAAKDTGSSGGFLGGLIDGLSKFVDFAIKMLPTVEKLLPIAEKLLPAIKTILEVVKGLFGGGSDSGSTTSTGGSTGTVPSLIGPTTTSSAASIAAKDTGDTALGPYADRLTGFDMNKFNRPKDQWSEKYKIGQVMSYFDPRNGITPEFIDALNALGIAQFSGSDDQLNLENTLNDPRMGKGGTSDVIVAYHSGDGKWGPWADPNL